MLNVIWMVLIFVGTLVAVGQDLFDLSTNRYQNGKEIEIGLRMDAPLVRSLKVSQPYLCTVMIEPGAYRRWAGQSLPGNVTIRQKAELYTTGGNKGTLHIFVDENTPLLWKEIFKVQKNPGYLLAKIRWGDPLQPERRPLFL
jgi:hypothetical protein